MIKVVEMAFGEPDSVTYMKEDYEEATMNKPKTVKSKSAKSITESITVRRPLAPLKNQKSGDLLRRAIMLGQALHQDQKVGTAEHRQVVGELKREYFEQDTRAYCY